MSLHAFALACAASTALGGSVLLVDGTSGPFFDLQPAVDAAVDGDVVLVRSGVYTSFAVVGGDLAVVADAGADVHVQGAIRVRDVALGQTLVVSGLKAHGTTLVDTDTNGLRATYCAGSIRVQDCELNGGDCPTSCTAPLEGAPAGARIRDCADLLIARSTLVGGRIPGGYWSQQPTDACGNGIDVESSRVALQHSEARGPHGGHSGPDGSSGGTGARVDGDSELSAQSSDFIGGHGGNGYGAWFAFGGNGGSGLVLGPGCRGSNVARTLDCHFEAGLEGHGTCSIFCGGRTYDGWPGQPTVTYTWDCASLVPLTGVAPSLGCANVVREDTALDLALTGSPGDRIWLRVARRTSHAWDAQRNGVLLVEGGLGLWVLVAQIGTSGTASHALALAPLSAAEQARVVHLQILAQHPSGRLQLGEARSVVVVDDAF